MFGTSSAQCDPSNLKDKGISNLEKGYTYIKSFPLSQEKLNENGEIEYSFVFSKGTKYMLTFINADGETEHVTIELYDPNKSLIAKNKKANEDSPLSYTCNVTGVYYMKFSLKEAGCGLAILSFKR